MANSISITFTQSAEVNDHIQFIQNYYYEGVIHQANKGSVFKTVRVNPGEVTIGSDAIDQAIYYQSLFGLDYGSGYTVTRVDNVVTIEKGGDDFISDFTTTGSSFATAIITEPTPLEDTSWFVSPYPLGKKAFTLDQKFFKLITENENTYFQFDAYIKTYDFFTNALNINQINQKVVPFKGKGEINLGRLIHRLMSIFEEVNDELHQYKYAEVSISCTETLLSDLTVVRSLVTPTIHFVAGLGRGFTDFGFLEFNPKPNRVTKRSFAYLNFVIPTGNYELRTLKNGVLINTEELPTDTLTTLCKKVTFETYTQGDIIDFVIDFVGENNENASKKTFCVFPNGMYPNQIVWENEFKLQSAMECNGIATLDPNLEFQSQKVYKNLVEKLEHLSSSKEVNLFIDTGWLLFTDIDTVESLMRSKRAWLIQGEKRISLRPIGKKLPKQDYDNELISFPLEFTINKAYDEETYTL